MKGNTKVFNVALKLAIEEILLRINIFGLNLKCAKTKL